MMTEDRTTRCRPGRLSALSVVALSLVFASGCSDGTDSSVAHDPRAAEIFLPPAADGEVLDLPIVLTAGKMTVLHGRAEIDRIVTRPDADAFAVLEHPDRLLVVSEEPLHAEVLLYAEGDRLAVRLAVTVEAAPPLEPASAPPDAPPPWLRIDPRKEPVERLATRQGDPVVLVVPYKLREVSIGDPDVVDVDVLTASRLMILPRAPGETRLILASEEGVQNITDIRVFAPDAYPRRPFSSDLDATPEAEEGGVAPPWRYTAIELASGDTRTLAIDSTRTTRAGDLCVADVRSRGDGSVELAAFAPGETRIVSWTDDGIAQVVDVRVEAPVADAEDVVAEWERDPPRCAGERARERCTFGSGDACTSLGIALRRRSSELDDLARARGFLVRACELGDAEGCVHAAQMTFAGLGGARDEAGALQRFADLCEAGEAGPSSARPSSVDACAIRDEIRGCAEAGAEDCRRLGDRIIAEAGLFHEPPRADEAYEKACDLGSARACSVLGDLYFEDRAGQRAPARGAPLYDRACDLGDGWSCRELGRRYMHALGLPQDVDRAIVLYERACELDYSSGCVDLALARGEGRGVVRDLGVSAALYAKACRLDDPDGCFFLARAYESGRGVARSREKAREHYRKACALGDAFACDVTTRPRGGIVRRLVRELLERVL